MKTIWLVVLWVLLLVAVGLTGGCLIGVNARHHVFLGAGYIVMTETNQVAQVKMIGFFGGDFLGKFYLTNAVVQRNQPAKP